MSMSGPTGAQKVVQVHPLLRCNLRCLHCYSDSGPDSRVMLDEDILAQAVTDAASEEYNVLGVSGGEPLLYEPLPRLLHHAHACGLRTTVTSNGMLLTERRLASLQDSLDLLAISLDGIPDSHNAIRGNDRAFESMARRLQAVREVGVSFGFIFTLTQHNLHELEWVVQFALREGASLLQIHPLEIAGRAVRQLPRSRPDAYEAAMAYLQAWGVQSILGAHMRVHVDLADVGALREEPWRVLADDTSPNGSAPEALGHLITPLVIQADGLVVPFQHGFPAPFALGNLKANRLTHLSRAWSSDVYPALREVCRRVFNRITSPGGPPVVNWYDEIAYEAARETGLPPEATRVSGRRERVPLVAR